VPLPIRARALTQAGRHRRRYPSAESRRRVRLPTSPSGIQAPCAVAGRPARPASRPRQCRAVVEQLLDRFRLLTHGSPLHSSLAIDSCHGRWFCVRVLYRRSTWDRLPARRRSSAKCARAIRTSKHDNVRRLRSDHRARTTFRLAWMATGANTTATGVRSRTDSALSMLVAVERMN